MSNTSLEWIIVARLLRPQGRNGEILVELFSDFPASLPGRSHLFLGPPYFDGEAASAVPVDICSLWLPKGKNEGRAVLRLTGSDSIEDAERLVGLDLITPRGARISLDDDATYISDLLGCTLIDRGHSLGTVLDVQFPMTPDGRRKLTEAAALLVVRLPDSGEFLVPFVKDFLVSINLTTKEINMSLPEGLVDLSQTANSSDEAPAQVDQAKSGSQFREK